jgi:hypothetical protein
MRRSTVLNFSPQLVFPAQSYNTKHEQKQQGSTNRDHIIHANMLMLGHCMH